MLLSLFASFTDWNLLTDPTWLGLGNYQALLEDQAFWQSLRVTAAFTAAYVPLYLIFSRLGLVNSFAPLILPTFFGNAFYNFLLRQSFKQAPPDLEDAAKIDGAGPFQVLLHVILPLSRPALATVAIFTFQAAWNDFLAPLIFLHDQSLYTLQLGLSLFRGAYNVQWAFLMASSLVVTLPVIVLFFVAQRAFIEGVGFTGTKI
jgi:multiple sugar transport system permease protein